MNSCGLIFWSNVEIIMWGDYQAETTRKLDGVMKEVLASDERAAYSFKHFPIDGNCNVGAKNYKTQYSGSCAMARVVIAEESSKCRLGGYAPALGAFGGGPPNIIWGGTPEQIERYGIPCVEGKMRAFVAITEPTGGSDPRNNISTRAEKDGDEWVLNGRKMWITGAEGADFGILFARTREGTADAPPEITAFIIEPTFPGINFNEIKVIRALSPYEIILENCRVPAENVLGSVGQGFGVAQRWLVDARIPYAAGCIGMAQEALDMACGWVKQRPTRDGMLADKQAIQWMIADSEVELRAARMLVYDAASKVDAGQSGKGVSILVN